MRVLNPNYRWTCDPYTADHNYMLSKTFKMCDPVVDNGKLDAFFCGIISTSPPGSPLSQAREVSGNESQDLFCTRDVDLKCSLDDCNPAAKALAELQVTLQLEYNQPGTDAPRVDASELSPLPVNERDAWLPIVARFIEALSADLGAERETTDDSSCSGSPPLRSSVINLPPPMPIKTGKARVALAPISAEQHLLKGKGNVTGMTVAHASPAVTSAPTTLTPTASAPAPALLLPVCTLGNTDVLSTKQRATAPTRFAQNSTSFEATGNAPYLLESKEQLSSSVVSTSDDKKNKRENVLQFGFPSPLSNGPTRNQTRAELPLIPTVDPVLVFESERMSSRIPVTAIQSMTENKGKRKQSPSEVIEPTKKKRRVQNKKTKASAAVDDAVQPSSSTVPSTNSQTLPVQRRKRARKSTNEKSEVIDVDQGSLPPHASPSTTIPQPNGLRQLLPASMRPVPRVPSMPPLSPGNGFVMPPTHTSSPSSVAQPPALSSQATAPPFNTVFPNNLGYGIPGVGYAENLGMPPGTFDQVSNYAQYLERQRALLLRQQMLSQLQQARDMNAGTSFVDSRLAPNGTTMPSMLAPTTTTMNNGIWDHYGPGGAGPSTTYFQNFSLQSQLMEPFDTFGAAWTPPVQAATRTHPQNWYP